MKRTTTARIAGFAFLFYVAVGAGNEFLMARATGAAAPEHLLPLIAAHAADVRVAVLLSLLEAFSALVLAVTLYALTRSEDAELALLAFACRVVEGLLGALGISGKLGLLWLATGAGTTSAATTATLATLFHMPGGPVGAVFFAVGSTIFSYLLLQGRMVPAAIAWLGVLSSALLVVVLPLQLVGWVDNGAANYAWLPAFAFAPVIGAWLLFKGVSSHEHA